MAKKKFNPYKESQEARRKRVMREKEFGGYYSHETDTLRTMKIKAARKFKQKLRGGGYDVEAC